MLWLARIAFGEQVFRVQFVGDVKNKMSTYKCYKCRKTYKKRNDEEWNDFKASEEFLNLYPECKNDSVGILCDDCNEEFKKWFSLRTTEEKQKMREECNARMDKR